MPGELGDSRVHCEKEGKEGVTTGTECPEDTSCCQVAHSGEGEQVHSGCVSPPPGCLGRLDSAQRRNVLC